MVQAQQEGVFPEGGNMAANNFYLDSATRMFGSYLWGISSGSQRTEDRTKEDASAQGLSGFERQVAAARDRQRSLSPETMSPEEYKRYIYGRISALPVHPSQQYDSVSIQISEEGFEAMQKDPEYEKWVLDVLRRNFAFYNPWSGFCGGSYVMHRFGASREEYRGESFAKGVDGGRKGSILEEEEETFWERRARRNKEYLEACQELDRKNQLLLMQTPGNGGK